MNPQITAHCSDPAWLYELFHQLKDYEGDAHRLRSLLASHGVEGGKLMEGACGTGSYLAPMAPFFELAGFDLDEAMLAIARARLPGANLWRADLRHFSTRTPADALMMLFGALCFLPAEDLPGAARCMARCLRPGGLALVEPWVDAQAFVPDTPHMAVVDTPRLKVCRQLVTRREGLLACVDFHYLVARPGHPVEHLVDNNRIWLHPRPMLLETLIKAGFELLERAPGLMEGSPIWVLRKPPTP